MADLEKLEEPGALDPVSLPLESPASVPVREDQVQSALGFLTHPKVKLFYYFVILRTGLSLFKHMQISRGMSSTHCVR